jgi:LacI family fructose operon transcriptional repressor
MPSIKDVAETAGVSTATVSRVLANKPHVRPEVRKQVLAVVEQLAYRPNRVARTLRSQQSTSIGLIVSDIRNPFFSELSRAVEDTAYANGYSVVLCNTDENPAKEELYVNLMHDENVAGIVLSPTRHTITRFAELNIAVPTVLVDRAMKNADADAVLLDNFTAAYELTTHLIEQGYQRIGAIFAAVSTTGRERQRGYEAALREHSLPPHADLVKHVLPKIETGRAATVMLLQHPTPPDAILTGNSLLTAGALQVIRQHGLVIPDAMALVGFDDTIWADLVQPAITVLEQPTGDIGRTATELLLERIAAPLRPVRQIILKGRLRVRESSVRQR